MPLCAHIGEEVAALMAPKLVAKVNGLAAPAEVASVPQTMLPLLSVSSASEQLVIVVLIVPVLEIAKSVVVADAVELPIANRVLAVSPLLAWIESLANGDEVPTP